MPTIEVPVQRFIVISSKPFDEVLRRLTATVGRPDIHAFRSALASAATASPISKMSSETRSDRRS